MQFTVTFSLLSDLAPFYYRYFRRLATFGGVVTFRWLKRAQSNLFNTDTKVTEPVVRFTEVSAL